MKGLRGMLEPGHDVVRCVECAGQVVPGTTSCERHLRGLALVALDRQHWPRLRVGGRTVAGDDAWRPWLREASGEQLREVVEMLPVGQSP